MGCLLELPDSTDMPSMLFVVAITKPQQKAVIKAAPELQSIDVFSEYKIYSDVGFKPITSVSLSYRTSASTTDD